jgi:hypothetical protein
VQRSPDGARRATFMAPPPQTFKTTDLQRLPQHVSSVLFLKNNQ